MIETEHRFSSPFVKLAKFVRESNAIEGIYRDPTDAEIEATERFLVLPEIMISSLEALVGVYQSDAVLRNRSDLNVRVGSHVAPRGGTKLIGDLNKLLRDINGFDISPWHAHVEYETLHPFTDGNGRSGRALWLWMIEKMGGTPLGFLHAFYYQTLENSR